MNIEMSSQVNKQANSSNSFLEASLCSFSFDLFRYLELLTLVLICHEPLIKFQFELPGMIAFKVAIDERKNLMFDQLDQTLNRTSKYLISHNCLLIPTNRFIFKAVFSPFRDPAHANPKNIFPQPINDH